MNYKDIRDLVEADKLSHKNEEMKCYIFNHFTVLKNQKKNIEIIVDRDIAERIKHRKWCVSEGYPCVRLGNDIVRLHDYVMSTMFDEKPKGYYVDHINQDKLDNRRINLRFVTPQDSSYNMPLKTNNTSGYTGVSKTRQGYYRAYITVKKKRIELGYYKTAEEARAARQEAEDMYGFKTRPKTIKEKCNISFLCELEDFNDVPKDDRTI